MQQQKIHPFRGVVNSNFQVSYSLSRAVSNSKGGSNGLFAGTGPYDQDCANCNIGRTDSDKSNQISLSGSFTIKYGLQIGAVGHFFSAPPATLTLSGITGGSQIFKTDLDGDGTTGDLLPGTLPGAYMHQIRGIGLSQIINQYNATVAGTETPAGKALVAAGLLTPAQLTALGGVVQPLAPAQSHPLQESTTRTLDGSVKYPITYFKRYRERLVLTPGVTMYNVTNMSNHGVFSGLVDTTTTGTATFGSLNGPNTQGIFDTGRVLRGTGNGTYDQGGPRTTEFSLKLDF